MSTGLGGGLVSTVGPSITHISESNWLYDSNFQNYSCENQREQFTDSKVHGTNMGAIWVLFCPDGLHVGHMNLAILDFIWKYPAQNIGHFVKPTLQHPLIFTNVIFSSIMKTERRDANFIDAGMAYVTHDDVIKLNHFPRHWPFVRGIHRSPLNSPQKCQWRGALMFSLICAWINGWVNNRETSNFKRHRAHYDVTVMSWKNMPFR